MGIAAGRPSRGGGSRRFRFTVMPERRLWRYDLTDHAVFLDLLAQAELRIVHMAQFGLFQGGIELTLVQLYDIAVPSVLGHGAAGAR